jgi:Zn-dependent protease with chaperone function
LRSLAKERASATLIALARLYLTMDEKSGFNTAADLLLEAKALQSDDPAVLQLVAHTGFVLHDKSLWWPAIDRLKQIAPKAMNTHYYAAQAAIRDGYLEDAIIELRMAQELGFPTDQAEFLRMMWEKGVTVPTEQEAKLTFNYIFPVLKALFLIWIMGLVSLFILGEILSRLIMRSLAKENRGFFILTWQERWLRRVYRTAIQITCIYYYISMPFIIILTMATGGAVIYLFLLIGRIPIHFAVLILFVVFYTIYALLRTLLIKIEYEPPGRVMTEQEAPALWSLLKHIAAALRTRPVDVVYLTAGTTVAVMERGTIVEKARDQAERCLVLGVGILEGITRQQLSAILAHEYGHFIHQDTAGGHIARQVSDSMFIAANALAMKRMAKWYNPGWLFINGFYFIYVRITRGAARLQEFLADRLAAIHYGAQPFSEGLLHFVKRGIEFGYLSKMALETSASENRALHNLYDWKVKPGSELEDKINKDLDQAMKRQEKAYDSHPSTAERIARIAHLPALASQSIDDGPAWDLLPNRSEIEQAETLKMCEYVLAQARVNRHVEKAQIFPHLPELIFLVKVVLSQHVPATRLSYRPPLYSTDPRQFFLPGYEGMSDSDFAALAPFERAFPDRVDAIEFARLFDANLVTLKVYCKQELEYVTDDEAGQKFGEAVWGEKR